MEHCRILLVIFLVLNFYSVNPVQTAEVPCKSACHTLNDTKINVHLIPHSHDDVGWLKTFSQYYYGTGNFDSQENAGVQYILNSTVEALKANADRRYVQVETAFFWKWWQKQSDENKQKVIDLVNSGQLEMTNGAWSMNDEAATNYQSIIDQFTWGFRILKDTVGTCGTPKIGWQIDPFGHSREHASLVRQFGFDGLFVDRIDYRDKDRRKTDKDLEFYWETSDSIDNSTIFTTMFPNGYGSEEGFCFDIICGKDDLINDSNVADKVNKFAEILDKYTLYYQTANIPMPMGNDFRYQVAEQNFENMDKLIKGFKEHKKYNVMYSTPSCYVNAVQNEVLKKKIQLKSKTDDFFPYASDAHSYWTGYFTSRPTSKRFEREGNNILQSVKQLMTFSRINNKEYDKDILALRAAMGVMQHHDAITGTEKQAVAYDYAKMLDKAIKKAEASVGLIIGDLLKKNKTAEIDLKLSSCLLANESICETSQKDKFLVAVQNPLSRVVTHYVRLPVEGESYKITGPDGEVKHDVLDTINKFDYVKEKTKPSSKELVFVVDNLPPLGIKLYYVEKTNELTDYKPFKEVGADDHTFGNETTGFTIDTETGRLTSVTVNGASLNITQDFLYYIGAANTDLAHRSSGAYVFTPEGDVAISIASNLTSFNSTKGTVVDELIQVFSDEVTQIIRVYKGDADSYIEFDWLVGNLQYVDDQGKEIITRFTIDEFTNNGTFYTDSNGREQIKRQLNELGEFSYKSDDEPISSNYYPVTSKIVIKDETKKLEVAVLNDRAQGGSSLTDGAIELMVHRKDKADDGFGVNEPLNEMQYNKGLYVRGQHYLIFGSTTNNVTGGKSTAAIEKDLAHKKHLAPRVLVADATTDIFNTLKKVQTLVNFKFEALKEDVLPDRVQILTLEPWSDSYLLRLEHIYEKNDDVNLSKPAEFDFRNLFTLFNITEANETTLGANQLLMKHEVPTLVTLKAMEIKTFIIKTNLNNAGGKDDSDGDDDNNDDDDKPDKSSSQPISTASVLLLFIVSFYGLF